MSDKKFRLFMFVLLICVICITYLVFAIPPLPPPSPGPAAMSELGDISGNTTVPPDDGNTTVPPDDGNTTVPPDNTTPPSGGDTTPVVDYGGGSGGSSGGSSSYVKPPVAKVNDSAQNDSLNNETIEPEQGLVTQIDDNSSNEGELTELNESDNSTKKSNLIFSNRGLYIFLGLIIMSSIVFLFLKAKHESHSSGSGDEILKYRSTSSGVSSTESSSNDYPELPQNLIDYVNQARVSGIPDSKIKENLLNVGWKNDIVDRVLN